MNWPFKLWRKPPPDTARIPMLVHPDSRNALSEFLLTDLAQTGIGYSEFLLLAIELWRAVKPELAGMAVYAEEETQ